MASHTVINSAFVLARRHLACFIVAQSLSSALYRVSNLSDAGIGVLHQIVAAAIRLVRVPAARIFASVEPADSGNGFACVDSCLGRCAFSVVNQRTSGGQGFCGPFAWAAGISTSY